MQIPIAVVCAVVTGIIIEKTCPNVPREASTIAGLPGALWIRALKACVVPLILVSMISSMQSLKKIPGGGGKIVSYSIWYYVLTTLLGLAISVMFSVFLLGRTLIYCYQCVY